MEKQNVASVADSSSSSPDSQAYSDISLASSIISSELTIAKRWAPIQWVNYSPPEEEKADECVTTFELDKGHFPWLADHDTSSFWSTIPNVVRPDHEEASVNFFFRHYSGSVRDDQLHNNFGQVWLPLYLRASADSPLRLATAAVTVNITMMWNFRGCDARPARKLFTKALAATREAISNASEDSMDELLMTILVFDLYDDLVLHYVRNPTSPYGKHKSGALALLKHRGESNFSTRCSINFD